MKDRQQTRSSTGVCFCAFHAYPLFDPRATGYVGGLETHAWQLADGLAAEPDWRVQFVVQAPRRFRTRRFGSVTVWNRGDGFDGIREQVSRCVHFDEQGRMSLQRWSGRLLWQLPLLAMMRPFRDAPPAPTTPDPFYSRIEADVLCCFGASAQSASVVATARALRKPSVLFLESNADLDERFTPDSTYVNPYGERGDVCRFAIDHATTIVTQHEEQTGLLRERFDREGRLLPNLIDLANWDRRAAQPSPLLDRLKLNRFALWVGRADTFHKRPDLCLDLARKLDDVPILMVLNPSDPDVEREVRASAPANVTIIEAVPFSEMPAVLRRAELLLSTGSRAYEGAPNLFLQAAASETPIASLEVPLPVRDDAGFVAGGDLDRLAGFVRECWQNLDQARRHGQAGREDVAQGHDVPIVVGRLKNLLTSLNEESTEEA